MIKITKDYLSFGEEEKNIVIPLPPTEGVWEEGEEELTATHSRIVKGRKKKSRWKN